MMKRNVHELPALVELAVSLGVDAINFFHMVVYDGLRTEEQSLRRHQDLSDLWLGRAVARAEALGLPIIVASAPVRGRARVGGARGLAVCGHAGTACIRSSTCR